MIGITADSDVLTPSQQRIALLIYRQGSITFEQQQIYKSKEWFRKEMRKLQAFGKVEIHETVNGDMRKKCEVYTLNPAGKVWVEISIITYQERVSDA